MVLSISSSPLRGEPTLFHQTAEMFVDCLAGDLEVMPSVVNDGS